MREMASHIGRAIALGLMVIVTMLFSIEWSFLLGVVAAVAVNAIYQAQRE